MKFFKTVVITFFAGLICAALPAHAVTHVIKTWGYNHEMITAGELSVAQGEYGLALNIQGLGDHVFVNTDDGAWNTGKPGKSLFIMHWKVEKMPFITATTYQHEESQEIDILYQLGKAPLVSITGVEIK